ncbi:hypothetical protein EJB05_31178, partial [Eragrostis curvula]
MPHLSLAYSVERRRSEGEKEQRSGGGEAGGRGGRGRKGPGRPYVLQPGADHGGNPAPPLSPCSGDWKLAIGGVDIPPASSIVVSSLPLPDSGRLCFLVAPCSQGGEHANIGSALPAQLASSLVIPQEYLHMELPI